MVPIINDTYVTRHHHSSTRIQLTGYQLAISFACLYYSNRGYSWICFSEHAFSAPTAATVAKENNDRKIEHYTTFITAARMAIEMHSSQTRSGDLMQAYLDKEIELHNAYTTMMLIAPLDTVEEAKQIANAIVKGRMDEAKVLLTVFIDKSRQDLGDERLSSQRKDARWS